MSCDETTPGVLTWPDWWCTTGDGPSGAVRGKHTVDENLDGSMMAAERDVASVTFLSFMTSFTTFPRSKSDQRCVQSIFSLLDTLDSWVPLHSTVRPSKGAASTMNSNQSAKRSIIIYMLSYIHYMYILYIYITCTYVIYLLHVHIVYVYVIYSLHVHIIYISIYYMYICHHIITMSLLNKQKKL